MQRGQAALGLFDGQHTSLACATVAGKVFLHSPHGHGSSGNGNGITYLNINKQITALAAGCLGPRHALARDVLLVGTPVSLHAYDVHDNKDVFYKVSTGKLSGLARSAMQAHSNIELPCQ